MIVSKSVFDDWLNQNKESLEVSNVPTPTANMTLYKNNDGDVVATIAKPVDSDNFVYEVK